MTTQEKYQPVVLPASARELLQLAQEREQWAKDARALDKLGTAREFELAALSLRALASYRSVDESKTAARILT